MRWSLPILSAVGCLWLTTTLASQTPSPAAALTPGQLGIALLTPGAELEAKLAAALASDQPGLRFVAARAIGTLDLSDPPLERALRDALEREQDDAVASEIVRALLLLDLPGDGQIAYSYLDRAGTQTVQVLAAFSASHSADELLQRLPAYAKRLGAHAFPKLEQILLNAATRTPAAREDLLQAALALATDEGWKGALPELSPSPSSPADVAIQIDALRSPRPKIREATVWHLLSAVADGAVIAPELIAAARPDPSATDMSWEQFGRELIARSADSAKPTDRADFIAQHPSPMPAVRVDGSILTAAERKAFETALGTRAKTALTRTLAHAPRGMEQRNSPLPAMRVMPSPWPGFLGDLMSVVRCKQTDDGIGALLVTYGASGRAAKVSLDSRQLNGGCIVALNVLTRLLVRDDLGQVLPNDTESLMLLPRTDVIACVDQFDPHASEAAIGERADIVEPKKVRNVAPLYPENAISARVQGTVLINAVIGTTGCVRGATVTRSVYPSVDFSALRAVLQWRFTPALLNGKPTEVLMSVTVNFTLQ